MTKNMGTLDRLIRTLIAALIAVLYFHKRDQRNGRYRARNRGDSVSGHQLRELVPGLLAFQDLDPEGGGSRRRAIGPSRVRGSAARRTNDTAHTVAAAPRVRGDSRGGGQREKASRATADPALNLRRSIGCSSCFPPPCSALISKQSLATLRSPPTPITFPEDRPNLAGSWRLGRYLA